MDDIRVSIKSEIVNFVISVFLFIHTYVVPANPEIILIALFLHLFKTVNVTLGPRRPGRYSKFQVWKYILFVESNKNLSILIMESLKICPRTPEALLLDEMKASLIYGRLHQYLFPSL